MKYLYFLLSLFAATAAKSQDTSFVYFEFDRYDLTPAAQAGLSQWITLYKNGGGTGIMLRGHCDGRGPHDYNDRLSEKRVQAVQDFLTREGLPATAIAQSHGFGKREPLAANDTDEGRQRNRRVEIIWTPAPPVTEAPEVPEVPDTATDRPETIVDTTRSLRENIENVQTGQTLRLKNINFYGGMHKFLPQSQAALEELLQVMKENPNLVIEIQGHICCRIGSGKDGMDMETREMNLSYTRARAVYAYLVSNGIEKRRMSYRGMASRFPLVNPERTEADRTANRRVEILIVSK